MKREHAYARALELALAKKPKADQEAIVQRFLAVVKRDGCAPLLPRILAAYRTRGERAARRKRVVVTHARAEDRKTFAAAERRWMNLFAGAAAETAVDPALVGGFRIENAETLVDASYRTDLVALYKKIMASDR